MGDLTIPETSAWLRQRDGFLILTHRRPDGDTLGCAGALAQGLFEYGKTAYVLRNPETTPRYARFVSERTAPDGYEPMHIIAIDTASPSMLPVGAAQYAGGVSLCIDHHPSNTRYAELTCLMDSYASCGEVVYELLMYMMGAVSAKTAECLYTAVATDTGCFAYSNTTANSLRTAAALVEAGAPSILLNKAFFRTKTHGRVKIEGMIYTDLEFHFGGAVAISTITREMMESTNATDDDIDDIASIPGSVENVLVGVTIRELTGKSDCKVSVRTTPAINANLICARFGGGGHEMAAGCTFQMTAEETKKELLGALGDFIE